MTERTLSAELKAGAQSSAFKYVVFVSLSFPSGTVYTHNSIGTISWGGNDWLGVGAFGAIEPMEESLKLVDNPITVALSSITPEIINAIKTDDIYHRSADIYVGLLDADDRLVGTPTNWITGYMEYASLTLGENNGVAISIQTRASRLRERNNKRYTIEDHQADNPDDLFFSHLSWIKEAKLSWGGEGFGSGLGGQARGRRIRNKK